MTTTDPEKLEQLKHHTQKAFALANPQNWNKVRDDIQYIEQSKKLKDRGQAIRKRFADHSKKHRSNWVAKETVKIFNEYQKPILNHPKPNWALDQPANISLMKEARRRVHFRIENRIKRIGQIEDNLQKRLLQNPESHRQKTPDNKQPIFNRKTLHLKSDVQMLVSRTQKVRNQAREHFNRHMKEWIDRARQRGSENPERDIFQKQLERLSRIDKAEHRLIHQPFKEHGRSIPQFKDKSMTQDFNLAM